MSATETLETSISKFWHLRFSKPPSNRKRTYLGVCIGSKGAANQAKDACNDSKGACTDLEAYQAEAEEEEERWQQTILMITAGDEEPSAGQAPDEDEGSIEEDSEEPEMASSAESLTIDPPASSDEPHGLEEADAGLEIKEPSAGGDAQAQGGGNSQPPDEEEEQAEGQADDGPSAPWCPGPKQPSCPPPHRVLKRARAEVEEPPPPPPPHVFTFDFQGVPPTPRYDFGESEALSCRDWQAPGVDID